MKKIIAVIAILTLSIGVFYSCGKKDDGVEIKVGVLLPLSGPYAEPGKNVLNGISIAIESFNSNNIYNKKIKLIVEDSKGEPSTGVSAFNKLINIDKVKIVLGDLFSSVTLAVAPIAEKERILILAPGSSNPKLTNAGDYIFRNWVSDDFDGKVMAEYIKKQTNYRNLAVIYANDEYGVGLKSAFVTSAKSANLNIVFEDSYNENNLNVKSLVSKIPLECDAIYLPGTSKGNGLIVKQLKEINFQKPIFANISVENNDFINISKGYFDTITYTTPYFDPSSKDSSVIKFIREFDSKYKIQPDASAAHGFDAASILIAALIKNKFDLENLKNTLYGIQNFPGVTGSTSFDKNGDVIKDLMIKKILRDGSKIEILKFGL